MFSDALVGRRKVTDDISTFQRQDRAGGDGCPHILTDLHTKDGLGSFEKHIVRNGYQLATKAHVVLFDHVARGKPAHLVKFFVVGQVVLRHHTQYLAMLNYRSGIQQHTMYRHRHADDRDDVHLTGVLHDLQQTTFSLVQ